MKRLFVLLIAAMLVLAACGGDKDDKKKDNNSQPTSAPQTNGTTPTLAAGESHGAPTWTPLPLVTPTDLPVPVLPTPNPNAQQPGPTPLPESCNQFDAVTGSITTPVLQPVTLIWQALPEASGYYIRLNNPAGVMVFEDMTPATTYVFLADLFPSPGVYGWVVWPVDAAGIEICFAISGEILAE